MLQMGTVLDSAVTDCDGNRKETEKAYCFSSGDVIFLARQDTKAWHFTGHPYRINNTTKASNTKVDYFIPSLHLCSQTTSLSSCIFHSPAVYLSTALFGILLHQTRLFESVRPSNISINLHGIFSLTHLQLPW